jgi:serine O-acetyltransferase
MLAQSIEELEKQFKEISAACKTSCVMRFVDSFLEQLPSVLENLNKDAAYILKNDPASNIEEVYLAYPGFTPLLFID